MAIVSFACECVGLLFLWLAADPHFALVGAALTGFGFALVFSARGVEAVGLVLLASRGAALSAYSVFLGMTYTKTLKSGAWLWPTRSVTSRIISISPAI